MKASLITCSVLAATLGFSGLASAQDWNGGRRDHERDQRAEQRQGQRFEQRQDQRREYRQEQRRDDRAQHWDNNRQYSYRQQPNVYVQPNYAYSAPRYYGNNNARFYRGGYLPNQYRSQPYYVNNWNAYPGLYAPPYGQQWVNVDGEFMLVALATGLIANLLIN